MISRASVMSRGSAPTRRRRAARAAPSGSGVRPARGGGGRRGGSARGRWALPRSRGPGYHAGSAGSGAARRPRHVVPGVAGGGLAQEVDEAGGSGSEPLGPAVDDADGTNQAGRGERHGRERPDADLLLHGVPRKEVG